MKVWLVRDLDPLPIDPGTRRLLRSGQLCKALADAGHDTTWITSNFDHYRRALRPVPDGLVQVSDCLSLAVLEGPGYASNVGLARVRHNRRFARSFTEYARRSDPPDIILTDIPTTEGAAAAIAYALEKKIPSVLSIRDLWPDTFGDQLPRPLRPAASILTAPFQWQARFACRNATSLVGISENYLDWALQKAGRERTSRDAVFPLAYRLPNAAPRDLAEKQLAEWGIGLDQSIVAFVGSWGRSFDRQLVLDTARRLGGRKDIVFAIAGEPMDGSLVPEFEAAPNIRLLGWIDAFQISILLGRSQIGLLPYVPGAPQGLPNKFFEYMAHGCFQLATQTDEAGEKYAQGNTGRKVDGSADAFASAVVDYLDNPQRAQMRQSIAAEFRRRYSAREVYGSMVRHIEKIAVAGEAGRTGAVLANPAVQQGPSGEELEVTCRHLGPEIEDRVRAWFRGDIASFTPDGQRSVRLDHPGRPDYHLKIKGAGLMGNGIRFGTYHKSGLVAPVFDFEGRLMEDVASGHDRAHLGGATFQQCTTEYAMAAKLAGLGYRVVPVLGYGSVSDRGRTSWFSVLEWQRGAISLDPPGVGMEEFSEANLQYGRQVLELALKHGLIGYYWYSAQPSGTRRLKDLHPFRQTDPVNMSRISWVMQLFWAMHIVSLSTLHLVKTVPAKNVPDDIQIYLFRSVLPTVTKEDHEALRRDLVATYMRTAPADFDPARLMSVLKGNPLTEAMLDLCPDEFVSFN